MATRLVRCTAGLLLGTAVIATCAAGLQSVTPASPVLALAAVAPASSIPHGQTQRATRSRSLASGTLRALGGVGSRPVTPLVLRTVIRTEIAGMPQVGVASWYGAAWEGRKTADGEVFRAHRISAASKTLPFGSLAQVCTPQRCLQVRINDRGPYIAGRIIDLSRAAADALGTTSRGVAFVVVTPVRQVRELVPIGPGVAAQGSDTGLAAWAAEAAAGRGFGAAAALAVLGCLGAVGRSSRPRLAHPLSV